MTRPTITLTVNGARRTLPAVPHAQGLLEHLGLDARTVVVEVNHAIVRRDALRETPVADGDTVELVHFVGGG
jgi:thiamine biosynthesis protein ThiS